MFQNTRLKRSPYFDEEKLKKTKLHSQDDYDNPEIKMASTELKRLGYDFFNQYSSIELAKNLLGKMLCRQINGTRIKGMIVETEAYLGPEDHASYSFGGRRTESNEPMYMPAGTCFIRLLYGMYFCFNISSKDFGGAVLIRAAQPFEGIEKMIEFRMKHPKAPKVNFMTKQHLVANGPSKLCIAFNIDHSLNKIDIITEPTIWLENSDTIIKKSDIIESTRIGINSSNLWSKKLLRYYLKENKAVSKF